MQNLHRGPLQVRVIDGRVVDYQVTHRCSPAELHQAYREIREQVQDADALEKLFPQPRRKPLDFS